MRRSHIPIRSTRNKSRRLTEIVVGTGGLRAEERVSRNLESADGETTCDDVTVHVALRRRPVDIAVRETHRNNRLGAVTTLPSATLETTGVALFVGRQCPVLAVGREDSALVSKVSASLDLGRTNVQITSRNVTNEESFY